MDCSSIDVCTDYSLPLVSGVRPLQFFMLRQKERRKKTCCFQAKCHGNPQSTHPHIFCMLPSTSLSTLARTTRLPRHAINRICTFCSSLVEHRVHYGKLSVPGIQRGMHAIACVEYSDVWTTLRSSAHEQPRGFCTRKYIAAWVSGSWKARRARPESPRGAGGEHDNHVWGIKIRH